MEILNITDWDGLLTGSAIGITVVFLALTILVIFFELFQKYIVSSSKKKEIKKGKKEEEIIDIASEEIAAVSMALHLFFNEMHDEESNIITIKRIERRYSPWNSKIYGLNNLTQR
jgi:Na+-transporting methylmalonyl-CoA/oxaloacetate decarboxylase gamma subunit